MKPSASELIRGIAEALQNDVLPELEATSWSASQVRSCLAVLAHLEVRVEHEGGLLYADNEQLRDLLASALEQLSGADSDAPLSERIAGALDGPRKSDNIDIGELAARNEEYQRLLNDLIELLHSPESGLSQSAAEYLVSRVRGYLDAASEREFEMFEKSVKMSPL